MDIPWIAAQFPQLVGLQPLAKGGQKVVFAAQHAAEGEVVLKLLLKATGGERLEREVLAGQLVECDRVPRVYETGSLATPIGECIWLREQRVQGTTLRTRLNAGALEFGGVVRLGIQLLSTLAQAEAKRIVHRDIKPENVMVDQTGNFWLLDFGLARHLDLESLTATRHHFGVGTFGYSAPEQMRNRKREIDGRADLFAVGVLLYECATGANPFLVGARDQLEVMRRLELQPLPRLQLPEDRDGALADLVAALVQKYPTQRPRSVAEALTWMNEIASAQGSPPAAGRTT
ncbi:MAG TPA: serine/threonine-protein kinase [Thermoanaerobaculales bacterium]|nr:serine/threonine-protein kinase [Sedimentisphaerales bacterium]HPA82709.1 serine/threonine-protein kinase [Thermoanaerobaculales bacterium]